MKVAGFVAASIVAIAGMAVVTGRASAAEATCVEQYMLCLNDASQTDGFFARTWAEQKCNSSWYVCVRRQAIGA